ncbi:coagulation factor XI-like isoform X2 [Trachinotus anak]|uniref:coagulation factor XI-like isoform X2 n=1 Tax=Trachinotus anak TaxID=443729 RepID=UPI0039F17E58
MYFANLKLSHGSTIKSHPFTPVVLQSSYFPLQHISKTKKMQIHLILVGLLSVCSLSFGQECRSELLENVDFPGTDITFLYSPDVEHCQQLCTQHHSCLFFTYVRADWTRDNGHFYCYLKSTPSGKPEVQAPLKGVTSGFSLKSCNPPPLPCLSRVYQNVDFFGADYRSLFTANYEECQRVCTQDPYCQFFTFVNDSFTPEKIRYKCHLKFSWTVPRTPTVNRKANVFSGFSHNIEITQYFSPACQSELFENTEIPGNNSETLPAASPEHCQALCSVNPRCTYFSYDSRNFNCNLMNNPNEMVTEAKEGVTSGLPVHFCQMDNNWLKVSHEGVDFKGSDIRFELMDDPDTCQRTCSADPNCQFYTYVNQSFLSPVYRRRCYLKRAIIMPAPPKVIKLPNVVSGFSLKNCV